MNSAPKTKTPEQLLERRKRTAELYLQCLSMAEIGKQLGVSAMTVCKDMAWCRAQWRTKCTDAIEVQKNRELGRIDHIEAEAWRAWDRTIGLHEVKTTKTTTVSAAGDNADISIPADEITRKHERLAGDPRFLEIALKCVDSRRKILGLDAPSQVQVGGLDNVMSVLQARIARIDAPVTPALPQAVDPGNTQS
jgi:hypothetical protein